MTQRRTFTLLRDLATYVGGWLLVLKQAGIFFAPPPQASESLIWAGIALISGTGVAQLIGMKTGTDSQSSSSPQQEQRRPSSSTSSVAGGEPCEDGSKG